MTARAGAGAGEGIKEGIKLDGRRGWLNGLDTNRVRDEKIWLNYVILKRYTDAGIGRGRFRPVSRIIIVCSSGIKRYYCLERYGFYGRVLFGHKT